MFEKMIVLDSQIQCGVKKRLRQRRYYLTACEYKRRSVAEEQKATEARIVQNYRQHCWQISCIREGRKQLLREND